jgi:cytoskeletal protein CcmA (bactofilin family)
VDNYRPSEQNRTDVAHIGKSVVIKGELSGSEDLFLDGEVEGSIELREQSLTVGPNSRIRANINAKEVVIHGKVDGNISASDRVELRKSAVLVGDIATQRIIIEDGAYFKGGIDISKDQSVRRDQQSLSSHPSASTPVTQVTTPPSSSAPEAPVTTGRS